MTAEVRAADLPEGSIVASRNQVMTRTDPRYWTVTTWERWGVQHEAHREDMEVDAALANGATVLRHGYGEEQA